jgi:hypothetical protein
LITLLILDCAFVMDVMVEQDGVIACVNEKWGWGLFHSTEIRRMSD